MKELENMEPLEPEQTPTACDPIPQEQESQLPVVDEMIDETLPAEEPEAEEPMTTLKDAEDPSVEEEKHTSWQKSVLMYLHDLVYLLAIVVVVFLLLFRVVVVSGSSMRNTLYNGDYLLLAGNLLYGEPKYGDIIVASKDAFKDGAPIVKRVIATEGQWVDIDFKAGIVYVGEDPHSMKALDEPYTLGRTTLDEGMKFPLKVDEGCVFVLGDNRGDSTDSRSPMIGLIDRREIMGKVIFLFMPGKSPSGEREFDRIGVVS